jgi:hypothetical protein
VTSPNHRPDFVHIQLLECLKDHLLSDSDLLVPHRVKSAPLEVVFDDGEATFDRVVLWRVSYVVDASDSVLGHDLLDTV